jgi:hypothetical protein
MNIFKESEAVGYYVVLGKNRSGNALWTEDILTGPGGTLSTNKRQTRYRWVPMRQAQFVQVLRAEIAG